MATFIHKEPGRLDVHGHAYILAGAFLLKLG